MHRVGKSATETEAETWESDLISVCSCAYMTGCFGRTHVFITYRLSISYMLADPESYRASQGHPCADEAASTQYLRVSQNATGKQEPMPRCIQSLLGRLLLSSSFETLHAAPTESKCLHYSAWVLLAAFAPSNYNICKWHRDNSLSAGYQWMVETCLLTHSILNLLNTSLNYVHFSNCNFHIFLIHCCTSSPHRQSLIFHLSWHSNSPLLFIFSFFLNL